MLNYIVSIAVQGASECVHRQKGGLMRDIADKVMVRLLSLVSGRKGQTLVEYVLILVLISIVAILIMKGIGSTSNNTYSKINSAMP